MLKSFHRSRCAEASLPHRPAPPRPGPARESSRVSIPTRGQTRPRHTFTLLHRPGRQNLPVYGHALPPVEQRGGGRVTIRIRTSPLHASTHRNAQPVRLQPRQPGRAPAARGAPLPAEGFHWVVFYLRPSQSRFFPPSEPHWLPLLTQPTRTLLTLTVTTREFVLFSPKFHAEICPLQPERVRSDRRGHAARLVCVLVRVVETGGGGGGAVGTGFSMTTDFGKLSKRLLVVLGLRSGPHAPSASPFARTRAAKLKRQNRGSASSDLPLSDSRRSWRK